MACRGKSATMRGLPVSEPMTLAALAVPFAFAALVAALAGLKGSRK